MFGVTTVDGSRRRLPQWMLGGSSAGQENKSGNVEEKGNHIEDRVASQDVETMTTKTGKGIQRRKKEPLVEGSHVLQKCQAKKRKRKLTEQDEDFEKDTFGERSHILAKCETKRNKCKTNEQDTYFDTDVLASLPDKSGCGRRKLQEAKDSRCESGEEPELHTLGDDDVELTADDLVMIAEEYIKADSEKASNREFESGSRCALSVASSNKSEDLMVSQDCNERVNQDSTNSMPDWSQSNENVVLHSSGSGDPAQDMLDLFLGPWLKKPVEKEAKNDILTDNIAFSYELESQTRSNLAKEEIAPTAKKKKTSLKDKVAMLLD